MKTNANSTASLEPRTHAADFAQRVRVNQAKLTSELKPTKPRTSARIGFHGFFAPVAGDLTQGNDQ
jgi:hypothetical protein